MLWSERGRFFQQGASGGITKLKAGPAGQQRARRTTSVFRSTCVHLNGPLVRSLSINLTSHLVGVLPFAAKFLGRRHAPALFKERLGAGDSNTGDPSLVCVTPEEINHEGQVFVHHALTQTWSPCSQPLINQRGAQILFDFRP